jgi:glycosyltransferase involved in cell wall biosynthesis
MPERQQFGMDTSVGSPKVAFIFSTVPQYKVWIVEALGKHLGDAFFAIHGRERPGVVPRDVGEDIDIQNNLVVRNRYVTIGGIDLTWVPSIRWVHRERPDAVILIDQVKIISNIFVHLIMKLRGGKVLFYSHGFDHQAEVRRSGRVSRLIEKFRVMRLKWSDAVIVYDARGESYLRSRGVRQPILISNNTLDIYPILEYYETHRDEAAHRTLRERLDIDADSFVITYLGRMIPEKKIDFFLDTFAALHREYGDRVSALIIGDGPEMPRLRDLSRDLPVVFAGYQAGDDLRELLAISSVLFLPGMVGLAIIEAFCAGKPLVTVNHDFHSPEICYLRDGENGVLIPDFDVAAAVDRFRRLVEDKDLIARLGESARTTAGTDCRPEKMYEAFVEALEAG